MPCELHYRIALLLDDAIREASSNVLVSVSASIDAAKNPVAWAAKMEAERDEARAQVAALRQSEDMSFGCFAMIADDLQALDPDTKREHVPPMMLNDWMRSVIARIRRETFEATREAVRCIINLERGRLGNTSLVGSAAIDSLDKRLSALTLADIATPEPPKERET